MTQGSVSVDEVTLTIDRLMHRKQWRRAIAVIETVPRSARTFGLWWNHGWALGKLDDWKASARSLTVAIRIDPDSPSGHWALGLAYSKNGHPRLAERHHLRSLDLRDSSLARLSLAVHYMGLGKFAAAEKIHLEGIALRPRDRLRLEQYADFLWDVGRRKEARSISRQAGKLPKHTKRPKRRAAG
jgi:tetratricopeptide (TPR) repeat protein